jgi:hypothetical protein
MEEGLQLLSINLLPCPISSGSQSPTPSMEHTEVITLLEKHVYWVTLNILDEKDNFSLFSWTKFFPGDMFSYSERP